MIVWVLMCDTIEDGEVAGVYTTAESGMRAFPSDGWHQETGALADLYRKGEWQTDVTDEHGLLSEHWRLIPLEMDAAPLQDVGWSTMRNKETT